MIFEHGQNRSQCPLRGGDVVRAFGVADGHMRPDRAGNPLRACHHRKHQRTPRKCGQTSWPAPGMDRESIHRCPLRGPMNPAEERARPHRENRAAILLEVSLGSQLEAWGSSARPERAPPSHDKRGGRRSYLIPPSQKTRRMGHPDYRPGSGRPGTQAADALNCVVENREFRCGRHSLIDHGLDKVDDWETVRGGFADDCIGDSNSDLHGRHFP